LPPSAIGRTNLRGKKCAKRIAKNATNDEGGGGSRLSFEKRNRLPEGGGKKEGTLNAFLLRKWGETRRDLVGVSANRRKGKRASKAASIYVEGLKRSQGALAGAAGRRGSLVVHSGALV